jgi:hypothetical protein
MNELENLNELALVSNKIAHEKGWWEEERTKSALTLLMQSEVSEAVEDYRNNHEVTEIWYEVKTYEGGVSLSTVGSPDKDKPCGIPTEIADVVIRICDYSHEKGYNLETLVSVLPLTSSKELPFEEGLARINWAISSAWIAVEGIPLNEGFYLSLALKYCFELADACEIDLWEAIKIKTTYNKTRSRKHGNKRI